ncbi:MAG: L-lysine 6-transaminase [Nitriliruptorales bacterium]|nr:L-lysine 6-transaminase [Nitriliruptorales bacterium]
MLARLLCGARHHARFGRCSPWAVPRHWRHAEKGPAVTRDAVPAADVIDVLRGHMLIDGYDLVLDTAASAGAWLVDARDGTRYLDMFTQFASMPLGMNPPELTDDREFMATLAEVAVNKPSNSDLSTTHLAAFVATFERVMGDPALPYLFLIEGGALAVENCLKAAFDWKRRHNAGNGRDPDKGTRVLHLRKAFHGRSGYTLSLTNTEPVKTELFPVFDWPRIDVPAVVFPLEEHLAEIEAAEAQALAQAGAAFEANPHDIACFLAEPIQGEGGDNHMRAEFLQAMQQLCHDNDALFAMDEVQTGFGMTGSNWAYQQLGLSPDLVAFGKKSQVCGLMAGGRLDEVSDNVFRVSSRINSTWGGNLTDCVRSRRILEVISEQDLVAAAARQGKFLLDRLVELESRHARVDNARGRGLFCAIDVDTADLRDEVRDRLRDEEHVLMLACGERSLRFRPALNVAEEHLVAACDALERVLTRVAD